MLSFLGIFRSKSYSPRRQNVALYIHNSKLTEKWFLEDVAKVAHKHLKHWQKTRSSQSTSQSFHLQKQSLDLWTLSCSMQPLPTTVSFAKHGEWRDDRTRRCLCNAMPNNEEKLSEMLFKIDFTSIAHWMQGLSVNCSNYYSSCTSLS